jgi:hypothetical protein
MSIRGPEALAALDAALHDIRREEDDILRKATRGLERATKFRETAADMLRQIATARLTSESGVELTGALVKASLKGRQDLGERGIELSRNAERLRAMERKFGEFVTARATALGEIDRQLAALRTLAPKIGALVGRTSDYEQARSETTALKAVAAAARLKVRQADLDREQKGRVFRDDPLFRYLDARGYGTPGYTASGFAAALDGWVARLVGFDRIKANYTLLNALPGRLRAHAEAMAAEAARAEDRLDALERQAIDMAGGNGQRVTLEAARAQIDTIDDGIAALQDERDGLVATQTRLADDRDPTFDRAAAALVTALGSPDLASLTGGLKLRGGAELAALAAQLDDVRLRIAEEQADARELHDRLVVLAERRRGLENIESTLKAARFDDPRSVFTDDALVGARLDAFLTGTLSPVAYLAAWQQAQGWIAGTSDWGGGIGLPRQGRETGPAPADPPEAGNGTTRRAEAKAGA